MFRINVRSLFKVTRLARAKKDQGALSPTGQGEVRRLLKMYDYGVDPDEVCMTISQFKSRSLIDVALKMVLGENAVKNETRYDDGLFYSIPHFIDLDKKCVHIFHLPYSFQTFSCSVEEMKGGSSWDETLMFLNGTAQILKNNDLDIDKIFYHEVLLNTPDEFLTNPEFEREFHQLNISNDKRIVTYEHKVKDEQLLLTSLDMVKARDQIIDFIKVIKAEK